VASAEENTMDILPVPNLELSLLMLNWFKGKNGNQSNILLF
jgi:hypothetical protein